MFFSRSIRRGLNGAHNIRLHIHRTGKTPSGHLVWTQDETDLLDDLWPDEELLRRVLPRRTDAAINNKAQRRGLKRPRCFWQPDEKTRMVPPYKAGEPIALVIEKVGTRTKKQIYGNRWTPDEDVTIKRLYPDVAAIEQYLSSRSAAAIQRRAQILGIKPRVRVALYTDHEDYILRENYPDYKKLQRLLPSRNLRSLRGRARYLGIQHHRRTWMAVELKKLAQVYRDASKETLLEMFPDASIRQIRGRARGVGVRKQRKPLLSLGNATLDSLRARALSKAVTLTSLDKAIGSGTYFQKSIRHPANKWIIPAIEYLGGDFKVVWED